jgi:hypothetical protein
VLTLKEHHIQPGEWARLSRFDKKVFLYQRVMEEYYTAMLDEKREKEREKIRQRQEFFSKNMPKLAR